MRPSRRKTLTSSEASWIWPATTFGVFLGTSVMAWSITIVWVPEVDDQLALVFPESVISRSSERGYSEPLVVTPSTGARNRTASQSSAVVNHGSFA